MGRTITVTVNGEERRAGGRAAAPARPLPARGARADRHARRLRHLHRAAPARCSSTARPSVVHDVRRPGRRRGRHDRRGAGAATASCTPCSRRSTSSTALQCGFCTPGMMMAAIDLLERNPNPSDEEIRLALEGNLCRCTGYQNIVAAVARRPAHGEGLTWRPSSARPPAASASPSCARRTPSSSPARAATSTTSACPACCTRPSCARRYGAATINGIDASAAAGAARRRARADRTTTSASRPACRAPPTPAATSASRCGRCWPTDQVRHVGEPIAIVLADRPLRRARRRRRGRGRLRPAADGRRRRGGRCSPARRSSTTSTRTTSARPRAPDRRLRAGHGRRAAARDADGR